MVLEESAAPCDVTFHFAKFESARGLHLAWEPSKEMPRGTTRSGPLPGPLSSRCRRTAIRFSKWVYWGLNDDLVGVLFRVVKSQAADRLYKTKQTGQSKGCICAKVSITY